MSRIGRKPVSVPAGVKVAVADNTVTVEGPKGKLSMPYRDDVDIRFDESTRELQVSRHEDDGLARSLHGLYRALVANMVKGVVDPYVKKLEIVGVGYQAQLKKANTVELQVGYANRIVLEAPEGVSVQVNDPTHITISGADRQAVGQFAANIRGVRPPEPYKGKGIRYEGEQVRRKAGKAFGSK